ncbi:BnaC08g42650D [Brassica napus]|uniref:BnaC08g42650D protein n=1 Tax=Brassica napus TaxID=3708 RepID=A0A078GB97_BRANA|nr:BnaC08g42650D [Brassica napus]
MPAGHGVRARTRDLFARGFRKKGTIPLSTYLRTFKVGEYVDVKVNGAIHKGMPHKFYHGRTGRVWNVTKRAVGVEVNKQIGNRIIKKRLHVRVEHVQQSRCAEEFKLRIKKNDELKAAAKARGETISTKRQPKGPKPGFMVEGMTLETGIRANDSISNQNIDNNNIVKERRSKPKKTSKKKKKPASSSIVNVGSEETQGFINASNSKEEATLKLLIPIDAKNPTPISSNEEGENKMVNIERKSSRSVFQRREALQQPRMTRISSVSNGERGAQVMAGWPSWLASVAGEAINGWIPRKPDSFEKLEKIGQGTYSSVYKARDLETNQIVALKKVRFANMDPDSVRFMAREIIILRRLDHPNVMKLEGLITSRVSGSMYLIFEYMEHDLSGLASTPGVKFSEPQIKCYMKQLLHGLEHCHSRSVLHRDIKGSNLLLDQNNNLKIGDFGLANFYGPHQKQPLTSRVVTLWYRPPELLLGSTDYGITVDMWSTGCILAELFNGKPIMPGRTEVEQLHKIFKLCGSPSEDYWKRSKLPDATIFKPQHPYKRCVAETFKSLPSSALALVEVLLAVEPDVRGTTAIALQSEFFTTEPFASEPSSLPKYQPRKESDVKLREEEARRKKGTSSKQNESKQVSRESKANGELLPSIQKPQGQSSQTGLSEKLNTNEDAALKSGTTENGYTRYGLSSVNRSGENVMMGSSRSPRKELRTQRSFVQRGAPQLSKFSNSVAARDASHFSVANPRWLEDSYNNNKGDGDWSQRLLVKPKYSTKDKESIRGHGEKIERMNYSGPLVSNGGNLDDMLKEHERLIQLAVRKARDKKTNRDDNGLTQACLAV